MANPTRKMTGRADRQAFTDPAVNPEHWVSRWESGNLASDEEAQHAAHAIKKMGFHMASNRYSDFVNDVLGGK